MTSNISIQKLKKFMEKYRIPNNDNKDATHQSWGSYNGLFKITNNDLFLTLYENALKDNNNLGILERPIEYNPLLVDIDITSQELQDNNRLYSTDDIIELLKIYNTALNEYLEISDKKYKFYVFEKAEARKNDNIFKDGFHIVVPKIIINNETKHKIRLKVIQLIKEKGLFNNSLQPIDKLVDKSIISSNGWFLYGSKKPSKTPNEVHYPYKLTKIYTNNLKDKSSQIQEDKDYLRMFSIYNNLENYNESKSLPLKIINDIPLDIVSNIEIDYTLDNNPSPSNFDNELIQILNKLDKVRFGYFDSWRDLLFIFINENWNISIFDKYVAQCNNYNKKRNFEIIKSIKPNENGLKRNTLYYWLKQDDPEYFKQIRKGNKNEIYDLAKKLTHNQVAKYYYNNIEPFKYCRSEASGWYEYNQFNILEHKGNNPPPSLLNNLSNTFQEIFINEKSNTITNTNGR